jgi:hypothetical protein
LPILNQLSELFKLRQSQVQEVAEVFVWQVKEYLCGKRLANSLIDSGVDKLPNTNKLTPAKIKNLKLFASSGIESSALLASGELDIKTRGNKAETALIVAYRAGEKWNKLFEEIVTRSGSKEITDRGAAIAESASRSGTRDLSKEIALVVENNKKEDKPSFNTNKMNKDVKRELKNRLRKKKSGEELTSLLVEESPKIEELITQVKAGHIKGRDLLQDFGNKLHQGTKILREDRINQSLKIDEANSLAVSTSVQLKIGSWELGLPKIPKRATKNDRLRKVLEVIDTDENSVWSEEQKISMLALSMGNIPIDRATAIWTEVKEWDKKYGSFVEHVEALESKIENTLRPRVEKKSTQDEMMQKILREQMPDRRYRGKGVGKRGVMQDGINEEDLNIRVW